MQKIAAERSSETIFFDCLRPYGGYVSASRGSFFSPFVFGFFPADRKPGEKFPAEWSSETIFFRLLRAIAEALVWQANRGIFFFADWEKKKSLPSGHRKLGFFASSEPLPTLAF